MPPRNKRKRPVTAEPPDSDGESTASQEQASPKRVKAEVKEEVKVEELSDGDFAIVLSDCELSGSSDWQAGPSVRRSAGGGPPRRGVDVAELYEEAGAGQLARSLGQVVKEECGTVEVGGDVKVEVGDGSPLRVSDYVRRAAAVRAEQLLRGCEGGSRDTSDREEAAVAVRKVRRLSEGKRSSGFKFTEEQRAVLRAQFEVDPYPDRTTKEGLSEQLEVEYKSVDGWFQEERARQGITNSSHDTARKKCVFGSAIYDELVAQFELNPRPNLATRKALAVKAGASVKQISGWFSFRRESEQDSTQRVEITPSLREELEAVFTDNPYPDRETRTTLAEKFGCSMTQISSWFHNRRRTAGISGSKEEFSRRACQFGPEGYDRLVTQFESDPYPDVETRAALAGELGRTGKQVSNWFQKRRASNGINEGRSARYLCALGQAAYDELVAVFETDPFPDRRTREALAAKTGGTLKQINNWFRGRRLKEGIRPRSDALARSKCKFGAQVYDELVAQFEADSFPDSATVNALAQKAGGTVQQIQQWFKHRRKRFGIQRSNEERARQACQFGPEVYDQLVAQFEAIPYPSTEVVSELAVSAGATAKQIRDWFDNRRRKHRRQKQK